MAKPTRSSKYMRRGRRSLALLVALAAGLGLLGFAYAQSSTSISLNSPVSFPVDI